MAHCVISSELRLLWLALPGDSFPAALQFAVRLRRAARIFTAACMQPLQMTYATFAGEMIERRKKEMSLGKLYRIASNLCHSEAAAALHVEPSRLPQIARERRRAHLVGAMHRDVGVCHA